MVLHVCEVIRSLDVGGAEVLLVERLRAARGGKRYTVVCMRASTPELIDRLRTAGIAVVDLSRHRGPAWPVALARTVRRLRPDVLNIHSPLPAAVLRPASRLWTPRPAVISTAHSVRYRLPVLLLDRATGWMDTRTVAVSPQVARSVTVWGARRPLTRIHGVDVAGQRRRAADAERIRREWDVPAGAFLVVHAGSFRPVKNHALLVRAAAQVSARAPRALFLLAGSGPLFRETADRVAALGLGGTVRLLGPVREASRLVAAADLLVLSSTYEGLPVVVMEALAAGVPVVATDVGGLRDLIVPERNGLLTRPGDATALAGGILRAMRGEVHARLREGARAAADPADIAATADWFEALYEDAARPAARRP
ncbi:glycosyltransferase [Sphaerisporangium corydalis]|uniref:Glycosyltransferase n=1 Tax=Sphaerisporangium corydalis TaxID=1441875 RepID=A0ABV9ENV4_9ACTN|nr:glycosyltransferase [Sphaerisporangium corydalis]